MKKFLLGLASVGVLLIAAIYGVLSEFPAVRLKAAAVGRYLYQNPVIIGALVGGVIAVTVAAMTLFGVWLTLRAAEARMKVELGHSAGQGSRERDHRATQAHIDRQHAADEAQRERLAAIRREVYVKAIAELVGVQLFIGSLPKQDIQTLDTSKALGDMATAVSRVAVVGETGTALIAREIGAFYNALILRHLPRLMELSALRAAAKEANESFAKARADIASLSETAPADRSPQQRAQLSEAHSAAVEHSTKAAAIMKSVAFAELHFAEAHRAETRPAIDRLDDLAIAVRAELGLPSDVESLRAQTDEIQRRLSLLFDDLRAQLVEMLGAEE
ncbi:hypothetical protein [Variovorax sp. UMC13]|uniref:hypothetical protein n=1 Tax=Variovorax sp. UMC13 TaxID=1862326 RepID=UPI0016000EE7|nr:hypothetical protein [Variovorax sp. UMC13]MBB1601075.1 hypothetical protein [Variovorax sp. UMC13]